MSSLASNDVLGEARGLVRAERYRAALDTLERANVATEQSPDTLALYAQVYAGMAEFAKAQDFAARSLALAPDHAQALYALGRVADMLDRKRDAARYYAAAIARDDTFAPAQYALGMFMLSAGHLDAGANALHAALRLDPQNWRFAAGAALLLEPRERLGALRAAYRRGLKEKPESLRLRLRLFLTYVASPMLGSLADSARVDPSISVTAYRSIMSRVPYLTYLLLAVNVSVFFWLETHGGSTNGAVLDRYGAKDSYLIIHHGEWWRFISPIFLHEGTTHLLVNGMSLYFVGTLYERCVGPGRFAFVYFLAGLGGSLASVMMSNSLSVGASGAIFGLFGALGVFAFGNRHVLGVISRRLVGSVIGLSILNLLMPLADPNIDGWAHAGGLLTGVFAGLVAGPWLSRYAVENGQRTMLEDRRPTSLVAALSGSLLLLMGLLCLLAVHVNPAGA